MSADIPLLDIEDLQDPTQPLEEIFNQVAIREEIEWLPDWIC